MERIPPSVIPTERSEWSESQIRYTRLPAVARYDKHTESQAERYDKHTESQAERYDNLTVIPTERQRMERISK